MKFHALPSPRKVSKIPSICSVRLALFLLKWMESCSGVAVGLVARRWRIRVTWSGSLAGQD